jgi:hypothetical protein
MRSSRPREDLLYIHVRHIPSVQVHVLLKGNDVLNGNLSDNDSADFNATTSQHQEDSTSEPDNSIGLTQQQRQIFNIYREAKDNRRKLPPIMFVTGPPGTAGKTVLQDRIQNELKDTKAFATMVITAVVAGGSTFASTLHFSYDPNPRNSGTTRQKRKRCEADMSIHLSLTHNSKISVMNWTWKTCCLSSLMSFPTFLL